jgi:hypothetical protein
VIRWTSRAVEPLHTADEAARRFDPDARIRVVAGADGDAPTGADA